MSAYMLWLNASREKIKSDHPGISITDLSKKAGELWKAMSKEKKEVRDRVGLWGTSGLVWGTWWERWHGVGGTVLGSGGSGGEESPLTLCSAAGVGSKGGRRPEGL